MKNSCFLFSLTAMLFFSGCTDFKYTGRKFDKLPPSTPVVISWEQGEIDPAKYAIIGRGILTLDPDCDRYDVEAALTEAAQKRGADAVYIVQDRVVKEALFTPEAKIISDKEKELIAAKGKKIAKPLSSGKKVADPQSGKWSPDEEFGERVALKGEYQGRERIKVWAIFWKNREQADTLLRQRREFLLRKAGGNWNGDNGEIADDSETPAPDYSVPTAEEKILVSPADAKEEPVPERAPASVDVPFEKDKASQTPDPQKITP